MSNKNNNKDKRYPGEDSKKDCFNHSIFPGEITKPAVPQPKPSESGDKEKGKKDK